MGEAGLAASGGRPKPHASEGVTPTQHTGLSRDAEKDRTVVSR
jgi:hypothetical protein